MRLGRQDVGRDPSYGDGSCTERRQLRPSESRAASLVIASTWVIDRVVKPNGQRNFSRVLGEPFASSEPLEASLHVVESVVVAVPLRVPRNEPVERITAPITPNVGKRCHKTNPRLSGRHWEFHVCPRAPVKRCDLAPPLDHEAQRTGLTLGDRRVYGWDVAIPLLSWDDRQMIAVRVHDGPQDVANPTLRRRLLECRATAETSVERRKKKRREPS